MLTSFTLPWSVFSAFRIHAIKQSFYESIRKCLLPVYCPIVSFGDKIWVANKATVFGSSLNARVRNSPRRVLVHQNKLKFLLPSRLSKNLTFSQTFAVSEVVPKSDKKKVVKFRPPSRHTAVEHILCSTIFRKLNTEVAFNVLSICSRIQMTSLEPRVCLMLSIGIDWRVFSVW